jgi:hypothetical protein
MTRNALITGRFVKGRVFFGMTLKAIGCQVSRISTPHRGHVFALICTLQRVVTCRVAVHATRMRQDLSDFAKDRLGTFSYVRDGHEFRRIFEILARIRFLGIREGQR